MNSTAETNQTNKPTASGRTKFAFFWLLIIGGAMSLCTNDPSGGFSTIMLIIMGAIMGLVAWTICLFVYLPIHEFTSSLRETPQRLLQWFFLIFALIIASAVIAQMVYTGLTTNRLVPARTHFEKCMLPTTKTLQEYPRNICADGWVTPSDGSGRCSSHGGVSRRAIERTVTFQRYTEEQCNERALAASWID